MQAPVSVTQLNNQIKSLLESTFINISVEGEVSRVTYHSSGHLYFTLKDKNSSISCVMFRGNNQKLKFRVEEGLKVIIQGAISVYTPRGSYQINCFSMEPSGSGALALAYEQLKKKLELKGYFKEEIKKAIPKYPKVVALVTSKTGAALQDMLRVAKKRWPLVKLILVDTLVQGDDAKYSIAKAIKSADSLSADVIVVSRGGGSLEDLWAFNEEIVADAIYEAKTPIVSAVGHEIDFLISDFVADLRAPTPSAAMETVLPDINEMLIYLDNNLENFHNTYKRVLIKKSEELKHIYYSYKQNSILSKMEYLKKETTFILQKYIQRMQTILYEKSYTLDKQKDSIKQKTKEILQSKEQALIFSITNLEANNPGKKIKESFAQIVKDDKPISLSNIEAGDIFDIISSNTKVRAKTISKTKF